MATGRSLDAAKSLLMHPPRLPPPVTIAGAPVAPPIAGSCRPFAGTGCLTEVCVVRAHSRGSASLFGGGRGGGRPAARSRPLTSRTGARHCRPARSHGARGRPAGRVKQRLPSPCPPPFVPAHARAGWLGAPLYYVYHTTDASMQEHSLTTTRIHTKRTRTAIVDAVTTFHAQCRERGSQLHALLQPGNILGQLPAQVLLHQTEPKPVVLESARLGLVVAPPLRGGLLQRLVHGQARVKVD